MPSLRDRPTPVVVLAGLHVFLGVRGVLGGVQFIIDPSGGIVGVSPSLLTGTPVSDFLVPGIVLLVGFGVFPLAVASLLVRGEDRAWIASLAVAVGLLGWVVLEGVLMGFGERLQYPNAIHAMVMVLLSLLPAVRTPVD